MSPKFKIFYHKWALRTNIFRIKTCQIKISLVTVYACVTNIPIDINFPGAKIQPH